jgi:crotonobetainyl-CoA:carnitine CoA-transferase CaiB-like acyl-CoA transferase
MAGHVPQRIGSLHPNIAPYGEIFETADNQLITFAIGSDRHFAGLCDFLNIPQLAADARFIRNSDRVQNRTELFALLQNEIRKQAAEEITHAMERLAIPAGIVKDLASVFDSTEAQKLVRTEQIDNQVTKRVSQIAFKISE